MHSIVGTTAIPVFVVGLPRAGLGETAADHVGGRHDGYIEPRLSGDELIRSAGIATLDRRGGEKNSDDNADHRPELGGLECGFGLCAQRADNPAAISFDSAGTHTC